MRIRNGALNEQVATMVKDQRRSARVGSRTSFSLLYLVAISLLVFGCKVSIEGFDGSHLSAASSGHGQGYDGMRSLDGLFGGTYDPNQPLGGHYLRVTEGYDCNGILSHAGRIWLDGDQFMRTDNVCTEKNPVAIASHDVNSAAYNAGVLGYKGGVYERLEFAPTLSNLRQELTVMCRYKDSLGGGIDVMVREDLVRGEYRAEVVQGVADGKGSFERSVVEPFSVSKLSGPYDNYYRSSEYYFSLSLQSYNSRTGAWYGHLQVLVNQYVISRQVSCWLSEVKASAQVPSPYPTLGGSSFPGEGFIVNGVRQ